MAHAVLPGPPTHVFAVVRDPVARMLSKYRCQRQTRRGTWAGCALAHRPFALWLEVMLGMARRHPHVFDNHLRPQRDFIPENAKVFRLEDGLQAVADWLAEASGKDRLLVMPHALKDKVATGEAGFAGPGGWVWIVAAFAGDYARFGYALPAPRKPPDIPARVLAALLAPLLLWLERRGRLGPA